MLKMKSVSYEHDFATGKPIVTMAVTGTSGYHDRVRLTTADLQTLLEIIHATHKLQLKAA